MNTIHHQLAAGILLSLATLPALAGGDGPPPYPQCQAIDLGPVDSVAAALHVDGRYIKDADGRVVMLRGINLSGDSKMPPFTPITDAAMLDPLPDWGINTLRLLFTWEALEANRCHYDEAYMQYYEQVVEWAAERDLYVIVDFHQDAYSRYSIDGCGEGFPEWAIHSSVERKTPDNSEACEGWGTKMIFDLSHHKTWEHFHKDSEGAKTRYIDMARFVADRMAKHANVIGYELVNEPWGTDSELNRFYNAVGNAIRSRHPDAILFVPPHALVSSGMPDNNIPKPAFDNFVYSPHYYDAFVILSANWLGTSPDGALDRMAQKAASWDVPLLLGEYGAPAATQNVEGYMDALYGWLNSGFHSGTQWNYTPTWRADIKDGWNGEDLSIVDDNGQLRANFRPRAQPLAIAGTPLSFSENPDSMALRWQHTAALGSTVLYLPAGFANGKSIRTEGDVLCQLADIRLSCTSATDGEKAVYID
ncbi:MAG TPA: cellulase family glycosylhydrolase [Pseudomonadales bacterium]